MRAFCQLQRRGSQLMRSTFHGCAPAWLQFNDYKYLLQQGKKLNKLKLNSLKRGRGYRVICIWKILERVVLNSSVENYTNTRTAHHCTVPKILTLPSRFKSDYCNSRGFKDPQLLNIFPKTVKDLQKVNVTVFKVKLDLFPSIVVKEPSSM